MYESLKNILGFYPKNISLYRKAFTHTSAAPEIKEGIRDSYERLEFLGDAVLGTVVADFLFTRFPFKDEGFLTKMRSKMVSRAQLNKLCVKFGLNEFIEAGPDVRSPRSYSVNGDVFEALIGAIYLDRGYAFTKKFILNRVIKMHLDVEEIEATEVDFKSRLIEWAQKEKFEFAFEVMREIGNGHEKQYLIEVFISNEAKGKGQHFSKKKAEQIAAENALVNMGLI